MIYAIFLHFILILIRFVDALTIAAKISPAISR